MLCCLLLLFLFSFRLCSVILLFGTCVFVCVCAHTSIEAGNEVKENIHSTYASSSSSSSSSSSYNINSVVGCFRACADNNQLLNYISLSIWIISFWISWNIHDRLQERGYQISSRFHVISLFFHFHFFISNVSAIDMASSEELAILLKTKLKNW